MIFILLLNSCLIFIGATANFNENNVNDHKVLISHYLSNKTEIIPIHYDIQLIPHIKKENANVFKLLGQVNIIIDILYPTKCIRLHAQQPHIEIYQSVLIKNDNQKMETKLNLDDQSNTIYFPLNYVYKPETQIFTIYFHSIMLRGRYTLHLKFKSMLDSTKGEGFFIHKTNQTNNRTWLIAMHFQSINARRVFPCFDEPTLKATFHIAIKHHKNYTALSNMPIQKLQEVKNNTIWTLFHVTPKIPTYLLAIMLCKNCSIPIRTLPEKWTLPPIKLKRDLFKKKFTLTEPMTHNYIKIYRITNNWYERDSVEQDLMFAQIIAESVSQLLGVEWALSMFDIQMITKVDHIAISDLPDDSIQSWGLILYRKANIIYEESTDPVARKFDVARLVARESAHQWFGNMVSLSSWSYLWLNDGIAILLGLDTVNKVFQDFRIMDLFVVQVQHESLHLDTDFFLKPLTSEVINPSEIDSWSFSRYIKAPVILRMLYMTFNDVFRKGIERYIIIKSAVPNNLWSAIETELTNWYISRSLNKSVLPNISEIMNAWTNQMNYPILCVKRDHFDNKKVMISVENNISDQDNWVIFVTVTTENEHDFTNIFSGYWLKLTPKHYPFVELNLSPRASGWIIINLQQTGYYRVNYDPENWQKIAYYLDSSKYSNIHVLNRAQIIDDAFHLMISNRLHSFIFWKLTKYLWREQDYIAWYPMFKAFEHMSSIFQLSLRSITNIKRNMGNILYYVLQKIGYDEDFVDNDLSKCLIQEAAKWACIFELPDCINTAHRKLIQHLEDDSKKLKPWWREWTYCKGLMVADHTTWSKVLNLWKQTRDNKILEYLTCTNNSDIIFSYLSQTMKEHDHTNNIMKSFQPTERISIFFSIIARHAKNDEIFEYILTNFNAIKPREISTIAVLTHIINNVYTKGQLNKIKKFVNENVEELNLDVQRKIEIRWSRVKRLLKYHLIF